MSTYCSNLERSHLTIVDEEERPYSTLHVTCVQSEVVSEFCPESVETSHEIVEFPQHSTGYGNTFQQTDLHYLIRNGMQLPSVSAFVDAADKTQVLSDTKRTLQGFLAIVPTKPVPEPVPEPVLDPNSEPTI